MSTAQISNQDLHMMQSYAQQYREELTQNILPFWLHHSKDNVNGGFNTCLDQMGKVYDTDKFVWQGKYGVLVLCTKMSHKIQNG
jgi:5-methylcytosine-specific restriction endonuclease McrBC regulatory subunit McrC